MIGGMNQMYKRRYQAVQWLNRLVGKMVLGAQSGMAKGMQEGMREVIEELMKGMLDPAKLAELARAMGIDMSELTGIMGKRPGFDPYMVLGLDKSASDEEIKKRYNELVHQLHPDKSGTPGTNFLFQMVVAAYEMIKRERGWQ
jgi:hypothetical protein